MFFVVVVCVVFLYPLGGGGGQGKFYTFTLPTTTSDVMIRSLVLKISIYFSKHLSLKGTTEANQL